MAFDAFVSRLHRPISRMASALRHVASPYQRYRHAQGLHALRVALAMLTTILVTSGLNMPHGDWASVSMLIVIGGIQHHGNIRKKATERAVGTVIGAACGLLFVIIHALFGSAVITYTLLALSAGVCAYYAIGRAGYVALLTAITIIIVAGHGDNSMETGTWRAANVLVGIVVALVFSFALPLHASYAWRFGLAMNLRRCERLIKRVLVGDVLSVAERNTLFAALSRRSISLRNLLPSVAKEMNVPQARLEEIQDLHRSMLSALEMLSSAPVGQIGQRGSAVLLNAFDAEGQYMRRTLLGIAKVLRRDTPTSVVMVTADALRAARPATDPARVPTELQGAYWLLHQMMDQTDRLRRLLSTLRRAP